MRLSEQDKIVLLYAQLQADASCAYLSKQSGIKEHVVRNCLRKLERCGLIKRYPFINVHALGFENFVLNFSLEAASSSTVHIEQALTQCDRTAWLSKRTGDYQWAASLFLRNSSEVIRFLDQLSRVCEHPFQNKEIVIHTSCELFPRTYLYPQNVPPVSLRYGHLASTVAIDELDHRILSALSYSCPESHALTARNLGVPSSTVTHRIYGLKERGIICGFAYAFYPQLLSMQVYRLLVSLKGLFAELRQQVRSFCETHPNIVSLITCIGNWDFEVKIEAWSQEEVDQVISQFYEKFSHHILRTQTFSLFKARKISYYPFRQYNTVAGIQSISFAAGVELQQSA